MILGVEVGAAVNEPLTVTEPLTAPLDGRNLGLNLTEPDLREPDLREPDLKLEPDVGDNGEHEGHHREQRQRVKGKRGDEREGGYRTKNAAGPSQVGKWTSLLGLVHFPVFTCQKL